MLGKHKRSKEKPSVISPERLLSDVSLTLPQVRGQTWSCPSFPMAFLHEGPRRSGGHSVCRTCALRKLGRRLSLR